MDVDVRITNTTKLLNYAIGRGIAIDPQLALDTLEGRLTEADLGIPVLESTEKPD